MGKVMLDLPSELERAIEEISERDGRSREDVLREALDAYVQQQRPLGQPNNGAVVQGRRLPHSLGIIEDGQRRAENGEDWPEDKKIEARTDGPAHEHPLARLNGIISNTEVNSLNIDEWLRDNWHPERYE